MPSKTPEVGMGATFVVGSDRYPFTIVEVSKNGKTIWVTEDDAKLVEGSWMSEHQEYVYTQVKDGFRRAFTLRKNGRWVEKGADMHSGCGLHIGDRRAYRDPCF